MTLSVKCSAGIAAASALPDAPEPMNRCCARRKPSTRASAKASQSGVRSTNRATCRFRSSSTWSPMARQAYEMLRISATSAGRSWPSISTVISEVRRTPLPATSSALTMRWRKRTRAPAGTALVKRTLLEP